MEEDTNQAVTLSQAEWQVVIDHLAEAAANLNERSHNPVDPNRSIARRDAFIAELLVKDIARQAHITLED